MLRLAPDDAPASVLGLDGKDVKAASTLTLALRKAFANRGLSGGEEISLEEMRLSMGCSNDGVACLSEGGKTLGVRRLVFGYLAPGGGGYHLDIQILDVETGELEATASVDVSRADLASDTIDQTAVSIVNELMPADSDDSELPPRPKPLPETDEPDPDEPVVEPTPRESGIEFGFQRPTPRWKWIGLGTSLGLTVLAVGSTVGTGVWLTSDSFGFRKKLLDAATNSLVDRNDDGELLTINDVNPNISEGNDLCAVARGRPIDPETGELAGMEGQVRNAAVVKVCDDGDTVKIVNDASIAGIVVFGVATLAFTTLLFVHKRKPAAEALLRRDIRIGIAPNPEGGLSFGGGLRF